VANASKLTLNNRETIKSSNKR